MSAERRTEAATDPHSPRPAAALTATIGSTLDELPTPTLLLDLDLVEANVERMAERFRSLPADLRPHIKVHKSPALAAMACEAGAIGVACATVGEVEAMAAAGIADVLLANQVADAAKADALAAVALTCRLSAAVDDADQVRLLCAAATRVGAEIEVLVELDVGMGRCGARTKEAALEVALAADAAEGLRFRGMQGYEGHCMRETDPVRRTEMARLAQDSLLAAVSHLAANGLSSETVSAGGTGTYHLAGANPGITEVQAGSYLMMDNSHEKLIPGEFAPALSVLGTVVSAQGSTLVLDCGRKAVGPEFAEPTLRRQPEVRARAMAEEHAIFDFPDDDHGHRPGDRLEVLPGYAPTTVNLHEAFLATREGIVVDVLPIEARGGGWR